MDFDFICFDTEDNSKALLSAGKSGFNKRVTQIAAITADGDKYYNPCKDKNAVKHFLSWLKSRPERYIYAHNVQYDLGNLFSHNLDTLDAVLVGSRCISARWQGKIFADSFNMWPMSVAALGPAFGLEKLDTKSMAHDRAYVFRDVEIIRRAMLFVWKVADSMRLRVVPPTLGGLAVKVWLKLGGKNHHESLKLSRAALYGGRVELFKKRNETRRVCWTDINSLYPFVMTKEFPGPLSDWGKKLAPWGVAAVDIEVPRRTFPVLPYRRPDGRILYPWGKLSGTWTCLEIRAAVERGARLVKVRECFGTEQTCRPYAAFVERLYAERTSSKSDTERLFYKLLMNNLYGRLGASGVITRSVWQTERNRNEGVPYGEKILLDIQMPLSEEVNWTHASYVTAYGRLELLNYLEKIGAERMIYCDTDSCVFDCPSGRIPFKVGKALGQMKLEGWARGAETWAPKTYRVGESWKAKGVPKRLARTFIETGLARFDLPFKFREAVRFYDAGNKRRLSVWREVEKHRLDDYDRKKRIGNRFFPCKVNTIC